jgi:hypothetical protein
MYCAGLEFRVLGDFDDHEGFDGVMLGRADMPYHFEFTYCRRSPVVPNSTSEDLLVFYIPSTVEWTVKCAQMRDAGFKQVLSSNPYWRVRGQSFEDPDGYQVVLENDAWTGSA